MELITTLRERETRVLCQGEVGRGLNQSLLLYGETIEFLLQSNVRTALMYEVPNMNREERDIGDFLLRRAIIESLNQQISKVEERIGLKVARIDPADVLCLNDICRSYDSEGNFLYADGQHLNADGALLISRLFDDVFMELKK